MQSRVSEVLAMYLPQFHHCKENDEWWGKGFTEWTQVKKATPLFEGHEQPKVPTDGYYDLLDGSYLETQYKQAAAFGLTGFNSYFYWSKGEKLLSTVMENAFENTDLKFRVCFTWANHPWTKTWENRNGAKEILFEQSYESESDNFEAYAAHLVRYFKDDRYIKFQDRPVFCIYKPEDLPVRYLEKLRHHFKATYDIDLYLVGFFNGRATSQIFSEFDAVAPFNPTNALFETGDQFSQSLRLTRFIRNALLGSKSKLLGKITSLILDKTSTKARLSDYEKLAKRAATNYSQTKSRTQQPVYPTVTVGFDNTPRYGARARILTNFTACALQEQVKSLRVMMIERKYDHEIIFVNAWNEWGEGMFLEKDNFEGDRKLHAIKNGLQNDI